MFTNGASKVNDLFRWWLVTELAVGGTPKTHLFVSFSSTNVVVGCLQVMEARWPSYFDGG